jgi:hypothetical protein
MHLHLLGHLSALIGCDEMTGVRTVECGKHLLATGKKMGWTSLCGTSQLGWCVPEREWDDPPLGHPTLSWDAPGG